MRIERRLQLLFRHCHGKRPTLLEWDVSRQGEDWQRMGLELNRKEGRASKVVFMFETRKRAASGSDVGISL